MKKKATRQMLSPIEVRWLYFASEDKTLQGDNGLESPGLHVRTHALATLGGSLADSQRSLEFLESRSLQAVVPPHPDYECPDEE